MAMGRGEEEELRVAKRGYRDAEREGNHEEAARWANVVGDILKRRGEYVEALRWLRLDYDVSIKHLPQKQLLPTCQSLGEVYLRLDRFKEALVYQKKHLELAKDSNDLVEQQRASTQLGRTYHEMFLRSENDHHAVRNAKKYFKLAMKLVRTLKESSSCEKSSLFIKEFTDAHNNIGMIEMDLDNYEDAEKILLQGLKICDDEEVSENDDGRSRLHNNLGSLYIELREWNKAREHIEKDILICKRICHPQGEAKGFINLGELHYRVQKYDEALLCYQKALDIAKCMEDEDALVDQINQNILTVKEAAKVLEELKKDEQRLKKLMRATGEARGTSNERKCLLEQNACLDHLIEKCSMVFAWPKHREFAKRKKKVASELCDKEKLSDSFLAIGESYQKLRNFGKARKWYMKSWNGYKLIGNLEGKALAKINIGEVLDSSGDWAGALEAFEEGYRIAVQGNLPSVQMSALDNMHYSHMIRFDNVEEARKLQRDIQKLKILLEEENASRNRGNDYCSETETEGDDVSNGVPGVRASADIGKTPTIGSNLLTTGEESGEDVPLASLIRRSKNSAKMKMPQLDSLGKKARMPCDLAEASSRDLCKLNDDQQRAGRKRIRVVISDDEADETEEVNGSGRRLHKRLVEDVATFEKDNQMDEPIGTNEFQDVLHPSASKDVLSACTPIIEESICSFRSKSPIFTADNGTDFGSSSDAGMDNASKSAASGSKFDNGHVPGSLQQRENGAEFNNFNLSEGNHSWFVTFKIGDKVVNVDISSCNDGGYLNIKCIKAEVACVYYLQLSAERRAKGLLPVFGHLKCSGKTLGPVETIEGLKHLSCGKIWIDVVIVGWVPKRLMKLYIDYCGKLMEAPNIKLMKKVYNLEVSEDEVIVSDCGLQDFSISPFLKAMQAHKTVAVLDISHNLLGNETMEKLQQIFTSSSQKYGGLILDLHCNQFGPTALFQICECSVMFSRLEVLNLSENRLTDSCSSYLASILQNCKALYSLNIEQCSITSRTVQKVADSLHDESVLSHLSLGKNNPISGNAMVNLLSKLSSLKRFSELSLTGVRLNKIMVNSLCQLAQSISLSGLLLGQTYVGTDGVVKLTEALSSGPQELVKLDISYCGLTSHDFTKICANLAVIGGIIELNLGGNSIGQEACDALGSVLVDPQCSLKSLVLDKCHLGLMGIVRIVQALSDNDSLEELHLAENSEIEKKKILKYDLMIQGSSTPASPKSDTADMANAIGAVNTGCTGLEVADSEDEVMKGELPTLSGPDGSCASSSQRNPYGGCQLIQQLSEAIALAKQLQVINLSQNGFSEEVTESLYASWSSSRCGAMARKHVSKELIHFSVDGKRCCGVKPCCKRE